MIWWNKIFVGNECFEPEEVLATVQKRQESLIILIYGKRFYYGCHVNGKHSIGRRVSCKMPRDGTSIFSFNPPTIKLAIDYENLVRVLKTEKSVS